MSRVSSLRVDGLRARAHIARLAVLALLTAELAGCVTTTSVPNSPFLTAVVRLNPLALPNSVGNANASATPRAASEKDPQGQSSSGDPQSTAAIATATLRGSLSAERKEVYAQVANASSSLVATVDPASLQAGRSGESDAAKALPKGRGILLGEAIGAAVLGHPLMGAQAANTVLSRIAGTEPAVLNQAFTGQCVSLGRAGGTIQIAACWAHARRKFFEVQQATGSPVAAEALQRIAELYAVETAVRSQTAGARQSMRQSKSLPLVTAMKIWLEKQFTLIPPRSGLADAIRYTLTRWDNLCCFLDDGRIELDTNTVERAIRPVTLGRKNHLFAGSDSGANRWATVCSLITTAKLNDVEPFAYLQDVLERMSNGHPMSRLDDLLPWNWRPTTALN